MIVAREVVRLGPDGIEDVLSRPELPDHYRLKLQVPLGEVREVDVTLDVLLHQESAERGLAKEARQLLAAEKKDQERHFASTCRTEPLALLLLEIQKDDRSPQDNGPPGDHLDPLCRLCLDHQNAPGGNSHFREKHVCR